MQIRSGRPRDGARKRDPAQSRRECFYYSSLSRSAVERSPRRFEDKANIRRNFPRLGCRAAKRPADPFAAKRGLIELPGFFPGKLPPSGGEGEGSATLSRIGIKLLLLHSASSRREINKPLLWLLCKLETSRIFVRARKRERERERKRERMRLTSSEVKLDSLSLIHAIKRLSLSSLFLSLSLSDFRESFV